MQKRKKGDGNLQINRFKRHTKFKTEIGKINVYYLETQTHTHTHTHRGDKTVLSQKSK